MIRRFKITRVVENGYPHYKIEDLVTEQIVHCDINELNETLLEMIGD